MMTEVSTPSNVVPLRTHFTPPAKGALAYSLSDLLYQSIFDAQIWPKFLAELSSESGSDVAILLINFGSEAGEQVTLACGDGLIVVDANVRHFINPAVTSLYAVIASRLVCQVSGEPKPSSCAIDMGLGQASLRLKRDWGTASILLINNHSGWMPGQKPPTALVNLASDFTYAMAALATMTTQNGSLDVLGTTLPFMSSPLALARGTGTILHANPAWDILFQRFPGFKPTEAPLWATTCREAVRHGSAWLELDPGFRFHISLVRPNGNDKREILGAYAAEQLVIEVLQHPNVGHGRSALMAGFGLTGTEVDILERMKYGASMLAIADQRHSSPETIRHHLKSIKRKTGITRQPGLIGLATSWL